MLERLVALAGRSVQRIGLWRRSATLTHCSSGCRAAPGPAADRGGTRGTRDCGPDLALDYVGNVRNAAKVVAGIHGGEKRLGVPPTRAGPSRPWRWRCALGSAIRGVLRVADSALEARVRAVLARDDDYASAGKPACDYDDPCARVEMVDALATDGMAVLGVLDGRELSEVVARAGEYTPRPVAETICWLPAISLPLSHVNVPRSDSGS